MTTDLGYGSANIDCSAKYAILTVNGTGAVELFNLITVDFGLNSTQRKFTFNKNDIGMLSLGGSNRI